MKEGVRERYEFTYSWPEMNVVACVEKILVWALDTFGDQRLVSVRGES